MYLQDNLVHGNIEYERYLSAKVDKSMERNSHPKWPASFVWSRSLLHTLSWVSDKLQRALFKKRILLESHKNHSTHPTVIFLEGLARTIKRKRKKKGREEAFLIYALRGRRYTPIQAHLRRRRERCLTGEAILKILRRHVDVESCTRGCPYHRSSRLDLGKFYFAEANSKAKMTKSRRKIAKLLPASAARTHRPVLRSTIRTVSGIFVARFRRRVV